jgi:two-component system, chemotaxis family, protein-glutamate methylesterase/glutaminase
MLNRTIRLPAQHAEDGCPIEPGKIFIAPPDHHVLIEDGRMRLSRGPKENRHRPAIDPLFRTAAKNWKPYLFIDSEPELADVFLLALGYLNQLGR